MDIYNPQSLIISNQNGSIRVTRVAKNAQNFQVKMKRGLEKRGDRKNGEIETRG